MANQENDVPASQFLEVMEELQNRVRKMVNESPATIMRNLKAKFGEAMTEEQWSAFEAALHQKFCEALEVTEENHRRLQQKYGA